MWQKLLVYLRHHGAILVSRNLDTNYTAPPWLTALAHLSYEKVGSWHLPEKMNYQCENKDPTPGCSAILAAGWGKACAVSHRSSLLSVFRFGLTACGGLAAAFLEWPRWNWAELGVADLVMLRASMLQKPKFSEVGCMILDFLVEAWVRVPRGASLRFRATKSSVD